MPAHLAGREPGDILPVKNDASGVGPQIAGDEVDEGRLAGAVIADEAELFAAPRHDRDILGGDDRAERFLQSAGLEQRAHSPPSAVTRAGAALPRRGRCRSEPNPCGKNRMTSRRNIPRAPCQVLGKY